MYTTLREPQGYVFKIKSMNVTTGGVSVAHYCSFLCCVIVFVLFVFVVSCIQHCMLYVSLDCPFLIALHFSGTFIIGLLDLHIPITNTD